MLFIKTNLSWPVFELIKDLEIKTSELFDLVFLSNTTCYHFSSLFFNYWLILFNPAVIAQNFIPTGELAIPTGTPTKEVKAEIETHLVTLEVSAQYKLKSYKHFCDSYWLIHFTLFIR